MPVWSVRPIRIGCGHENNTSNRIRLLTLTFLETEKVFGIFFRLKVVS